MFININFDSPATPTITPASTPMNKRYTFLLPALLLAMYVRAQDAQYWQNGYQPGGLITPGAVIASDNDSGFFYYNPAIMALHPKTSVTASANIYQYRSLKVKNGVGTGLDLRGRSMRIVPQLVSGTILLNRNNGLSVGYALVTQPLMNFQTTQRQDKQMNVLNDSYSPGNEFYVGQYAAHNHSSRTMASLAAAVKVSERLAIGFTAEGQLYNQDFAESYSSRALINVDTDFITQPVTSVQSSYEITYWHVGLRLKAGLAYEAGRHHFGLLLSSPLIGIRGRAILNSDLLISNLIQPGTAYTLNALANGRQAALPVSYKMPLSIALGYTYDYGRGQLYAAAEHYLNLNTYNIITPRNESFIRPDTGSNNQATQELLQFREERSSVTNFALGFSYAVQKSTMLYLSLSTDLTFVPDDRSDPDYRGQDPYTLSWNAYNVQLGGSFRRQRFHMRAGLLLSYGQNSRYLRPVDFDHPSDENFMLGNPVRTTARFFSAGLMLSYIHNF